MTVIRNRVAVVMLGLSVSCATRILDSHQHVESDLSAIKPTGGGDLAAAEMERLKAMLSGGSKKKSGLRSSEDLAANEIERLRALVGSDSSGGTGSQKQKAGRASQRRIKGEDAAGSAVTSELQKLRALLDEAEGDADDDAPEKESLLTNEQVKMQEEIERLRAELAQRDNVKQKGGGSSKRRAPPKGRRGSQRRVAPKRGGKFKASFKRPGSQRKGRASARRGSQRRPGSKRRGR